jgi:hypothetical protein
MKAGKTKVTSAILPFLYTREYAAVLQLRRRIAVLYFFAFLRDANNMFYYANNVPAPQTSQVEYFSCKRPDTLVLPSSHHWRETNVHDKMDRHFYAYANLNFQLDLFRWCLTIKRPS